MTYNEADLLRMETDPVMTRAYFWQVGQNALLMAVKAREARNLDRAEWLGRFGRTVLDNIDILVASLFPQEPSP